MAKQSVLSFEEKLLGNTQVPLSKNEPEQFIPYEPGDNFDIQKYKQEYDLDLSTPFDRSHFANYGGKYYRGSIEDPSQETIQGENQPWTSKAINGFVGHTVSIATKFGTGVGELGGGVYDLLTNVVPGVAQNRKDKTGSYFPHLFENFLTKGLDYIENDLIEQKLLPVYGGQKYYSGNIFQQMGDMKFWSSDAADAAAFTFAAYLPIGAFTKAAKLMKMIPKGAELLKDGTVAFTKTGEILKGVKALSTKGKLFTTLGTATWNTGMEAGLEAKQGLDVMRESLATKNYELPYRLLTKEQKQEVNQESAPYAANIFNANVGVLAGPNIIQAAFFVGPVKTASNKLMKAVRAGTFKPGDISYLRKAVSKSLVAMGTEGTWEEGMQNAVQNYEAHKADDSSFLKRGPGYVYEWLQGWNTTEGQKSMFLGALVGLGYGARAGIVEAQEEKRFVYGGKG